MLLSELVSREEFVREGLEAIEYDPEFQLIRMELLSGPSVGCRLHVLVIRCRQTAIDLYIIETKLL